MDAKVTERHRKLAEEIRDLAFSWINLKCKDMPWYVLDGKIADILANNEREVQLRTLRYIEQQWDDYPGTFESVLDKEIASLERGAQKGTGR